MARKRFNRAAICSSSNYESSKKAHREFIKEQHVVNAEVITVIACEVKVTKQAYISVFGKLIPLTPQEVLLHGSLNIIYK